MVISGDVHFLIKHKGSFNNANICRFSINTGFWGNVVEIPRSQISPDSVAVSKKFHEKFKITLILKDYWKICSDVRDRILKSYDVWEKWRNKTQKTTKEWDTINDILNNHEPYPNQIIGEGLWFNDPNKIDYYEVVTNELAVNCEHYNLIQDNDLQSGGNREVHKVEVDEDEEFKSNMVSSKADRNTLVANRGAFDNVKEKDPEIYRSVNEFHGEHKNSRFRSKELLQTKRKDIEESQDQDLIQMNSLSSSSDSKNSGGSDYDFKQRKRKSKKFMQKFQTNGVMNNGNENEDNECPDDQYALDLNSIHDEIEVKSENRRASSVHKI